MAPLSHAQFLWAGHWERPEPENDLQFAHSFLGQEQIQKVEFGFFFVFSVGSGITERQFQSNSLGLTPKFNYYRTQSQATRKKEMIH